MCKKKIVNFFRGFLHIFCSIKKNDELIFVSFIFLLVFHFIIFILFSTNELLKNVVELKGTIHTQVTKEIKIIYSYSSIRRKNLYLCFVYWFKLWFYWLFVHTCFRIL